LDGGQNKTITLTANQTGIFKYECIYHMPSMTGQLVVSPVMLDEFRAQQGQKESSLMNKGDFPLFLTPISMLYGTSQSSLSDMPTGR
jgi:hypothetical protein